MLLRHEYEYNTRTGIDTRSIRASTRGREILDGRRLRRARTRSRRRRARPLPEARAPTRIVALERRDDTPQ